MTFQRPMIVIAAIAMTTGCASVERSDSSAPLTEKNQKRLDKALAGKEAGEPVRCVSKFRSNSMTPVSDDKILYRRSSKLVYVNELEYRCRGLDDRNDILVFRNPISSSQYCEGDIVRLVDRHSGIEGATCRLGKFRPYKRIAAN